VAEYTEFSIKPPYQTNTKHPVLWIISHAIHRWYFFVMSMAGAIGNALLASVPAILIGRAVNLLNATTAMPPADFRAQLGQYAWLVFGSQALRALLMLVRGFGFEILAQFTERVTRNELYISLLGKNMTFHSLQSIGDIMARATNDVREVNMFFSPGVNLVFGSLIFLFMPLFLAPGYHPQLILLPVIFIILYGIALWRYLIKMNVVSTNMRSAFGKLNTRLSESLDGIEIVKGGVQEETEIKLFHQNLQAYRDVAVEQGKLEATFIPGLLLEITIALGILHGVILYSQGLIQLGDVIAYSGILSMLGFPTSVSRFAYTRISMGIAGARRILELINAQNNLDQNVAGVDEKLLGDVTFQNASFAYPDAETNALEDISFSVNRGQTIAIVGQTGYGKTSLVKLINRTYDATDGAVLIDGINVKDWNLETLRKQISIIEQDIFLFSRSIAENIAFGHPESSMDDIIAAAKEAQAHDFITSFAEGYETVVGERGATLSGGQKQRIALARAFLTNPSILILDDSTSSIDSATEDKIQQAIFKAAENRTTFIITHRLSQIRWADRIVVLKKGRLAASGSHEDLLATSEAYRNIFNDAV
jgi:ATP-binding cassette subfamily B protein